MEPVSIQLLESIAKDRDASSLMASLFQTVTNDMKSSQPVWEDFASKAGKLHTCLKNTLAAVTSFLDAFQRVADMAAGTKGASKDIGTALTRICLRHRTVEVRVRECTSTLLDSMIVPLQEKLEDWKKYTAHLEREHAKEYRRHRTELKKRAAEALKMQKKAHKLKTPEARRSLDLLLTDVQDRYQRLETCERGSVEAALVEERRRFCRFVTWLLPFVRGEVAAAEEVFRLTEPLDQLESCTAEPSVLPPSALQLISDLKRSADGAAEPGPGGPSGSPPRSPLSPRAASSLGSRQSSLCSISSLQSSSSGGGGGAAPAAASRPRSASQAAAGWAPLAAPAHRVASVSSHDSGFTSQDTLFVKPATPPPPAEPVSETDGGRTWGASPPPPPPETPPPPPPPDSEAPPPPRQRPHTISSGFVRGGVLQRAPLSPSTFVPHPPAAAPPVSGRPPVPTKSRLKQKPRRVLSHYASPAEVVLPDYHQSAPHMVVPQPVYANMAELREMAALKEEESTAPPPPERAAAPAPAPAAVAAAAVAAAAAAAANLRNSSLASGTQQCERSESEGSTSSGYDSVHAAASAGPPPEDPPDVRPAPAVGTLRRSRSQTSCPPAPPPPPVRRESAAGPLYSQQQRRPRSLAGPGAAPLSMPPTAAAERSSPPDSPVTLRRAAATRDPSFLQCLSARLSAGRASERASAPVPAPAAAAPVPAASAPGPAPPRPTTGEAVTSPPPPPPPPPPSPPPPPPGPGAPGRRL
ncbi:protein MTSS 2-like isoform X2 [Amphibalanus amphitrite]|uniref:protein MTSS 2-like isoform X2 n=1 Tax=Amphibalanus amphitrite TaxID=1232801 RepID=UPI001C914737|nr:protein MTSS 2-like isoform X2 [Amphibalanus amphitrite]